MKIVVNIFFSVPILNCVLTLIYQLLVACTIVQTFSSSSSIYMHSLAFKGSLDLVLELPKPKIKRNWTKKIS